MIFWLRYWNSKHSEGLDLSATLRNPATPARTSLMFAYRKVQRALRDERYKLIRYPLVDRTQLFDLRADPHELTNLADQPAYAAKVAELSSRLAPEMAGYADTSPLVVAHPQPAAWTPPR